MNEEDRDFFQELKKRQPDMFPTDVQIPEGPMLRNVHPAANCEGRGCVIHHPSNHKMRHWPAKWVDHGVGLHAERYCQHRVGHPDPDDLAFYDSVGINKREHDCDGCCDAA
jgi:hypothetical protein